MVEEHLPEVEVLIGQTDMPAERLERARKLRAIINIEGNFLPNIDYATCFRRGIWVLNASPVFAQTVAEMALGMMLDLARGISVADRAFREGREVYGLESNAESFLIRGQPVGLIGFGDLGRAFRRLLVPFDCPVKVYDPWLPDLLIRDHGCMPAGLDEVLATSRIIAVFAAVTSDNQAMLGREQLELIRPGSLFLLMSRAAVVDFEALVDCVAQGRFKASTDVFPEEPWPADHRVRAARRHAALGAPRRRAGRGVQADRRAGAGRPRADPERPAAGDVQARRARDGRPPALDAGAGLVSYPQTVDNARTFRQSGRAAVGQTWRSCGIGRRAPEICRRDRISIQAGSARLAPRRG